MIESLQVAETLMFCRCSGLRLLFCQSVSVCVAVMWMHLREQSSCMHVSDSEPRLLSLTIRDVYTRDQLIPYCVLTAIITITK